jgi:hypothetical protein
LARESFAQDSLALATLRQDNPLPEADYESICAAMMETAHGRWFLAEYAQRNRNADTKLVLGAIDRIEAAIRGEAPPPSDAVRAQLKTQLLAMAGVVAQSKADMAALATGHETAEAANARAQKVTAVLRDLSDQIHTMLDAWGGATAASASPAETAEAPARETALALVEPDITGVVSQAPEAIAPEAAIAPPPPANSDEMFPDWLMASEQDPALDPETGFVPFEFERSEPEPPLGLAGTEPPAEAERARAADETAEEIPQALCLDLSYEPSSDVAAPVAVEPAAEIHVADILPQPEIAEPESAEAAPASEPAEPLTFEEHLRIAFTKAVEEEPARAVEAILPPLAAIVVPVETPAQAPAQTIAEAPAAALTAAPEVILPPPPAPIVAARPSLPRPEPADPMAAIMALSEEERIALCS